MKQHKTSGTRPKSDREVMEKAVPDRHATKTIHLGPREAEVWNGLRELYEEKSAPLTSEESSSIVNRFCRAGNPFVMLNLLERKGALQSDEGKTQDRTRIPRTRDVRIMVRSTEGGKRVRRQFWPPCQGSSQTSDDCPADTTTGIEDEPEEKAVTGLLVLPTMSPQGITIGKNEAVIELTQRQCVFYEALMEEARRANYARLSSTQTFALINDNQDFNSGMLHAFDHRCGLTVPYRQPGAIRKYERNVVFTRYRNRAHPQVFTPPECEECEEVVLSPEAPPEVSVSRVRTSGELIQNKMELERQYEDRQRCLRRERSEQLSIHISAADRQIALIEQELESVRHQRADLVRALDGLDEESLDDVVMQQIATQLDRVGHLIDNYDQIVTLLGIT